MHAASTSPQEALPASARPGAAPGAWWSTGLDHGPLAGTSTGTLEPRRLTIQGLTRQGRPFRPSDWAERLAGAMSCFRPGGGAGGISAAIGYSPFCFPRAVEGVKCVIVSEELRVIEPMAWDFVLNFARDNELQVVDASRTPEPLQGAATQ